MLYVLKLNFTNFVGDSSHEDKYVIYYIPIVKQVGPFKAVFLNAGPRPRTGPWHQLYRAARGLMKLQYATGFH